MVSPQQFAHLKRQLGFLEFLAALQLLFIFCFLLFLLSFSILRMVINNHHTDSGLTSVYYGLFYAWLAFLGATIITIFVRLPIVLHNERELAPFQEQIENSKFRGVTRRDFTGASRFVFATIDLLVTTDLSKNLVNAPTKTPSKLALPPPSVDTTLTFEATEPTNGVGTNTPESTPKITLKGFSYPITIVPIPEPGLNHYPSPFVQAYYTTWRQIYTNNPARFNALVQEHQWWGRIGRQLDSEIAHLPLGTSGYTLLVGYNDQTLAGLIQLLGGELPKTHFGHLLKPVANLKIASLPKGKVTPNDILELHYNHQDLATLKELYVALWRDFYQTRPWEYCKVVRNAYWLHRVGESIETEVEFAYIPHTKIKVITGYSRAYLLKHIVQIWNDTYEPVSNDPDSDHSNEDNWGLMGWLKW